jgi:hypothetical protein
MKKLYQWGLWRWPGCPMFRWTTGTCILFIWAIFLIFYFEQLYRYLLSPPFTNLVFHLFTLLLLCLQAQQDGKFENKNIYSWLHPAKVSFIPAILIQSLIIHAWGFRVLLLPVIYLQGMPPSSKWSHVGNFIFLVCSSILIFHIWQVCAEASQNWESQEVRLLHAL